LNLTPSQKGSFLAGIGLWVLIWVSIWKSKQAGEHVSPSPTPSEHWLSSGESANPGKPMFATDTQSTSAHTLLTALGTVKAGCYVVSWAEVERRRHILSIVACRRPFFPVVDVGLRHPGSS
jgi:hypothetical protein